MGTQVSIVALDLTMVLGTALGLSLLLRVPVLPCILVSGLDTLVLVLLPQLGMRKAEKLTVSVYHSPAHLLLSWPAWHGIRQILFYLHSDLDASWQIC